MAIFKSLCLCWLIVILTLIHQSSSYSNHYKPMNKWNNILTKTIKSKQILSSSSSSSSSPSTTSPSFLSSDNKCEIEILTRGTCMVNNHRIKPRIILNLKTKPGSIPLSPKEKMLQKKQFQKRPIDFLEEKEKGKLVW